MPKMSNYRVVPYDEVGWRDVNSDLVLANDRAEAWFKDNCLFDITSPYYASDSLTADGKYAMRDLFHVDEKVAEEEERIMNQRFLLRANMSHQTRGIFVVSISSVVICVAFLTRGVLLTCTCSYLDIQKRKDAGATTKEVLLWTKGAHEATVKTAKRLWSIKFASIVEAKDNRRKMS